MRDGDEYGGGLFAEDDEVYAGGESAETGVAYHRFLELCDFSVKDGKGIESELAGWVYEGKITQTQRGLLDISRLCAILAMPVFGGVGKAENFREREFVCRLSPVDYRALKCGESPAYGPDGGGGGVIVQGAIDLLLVKREGQKAVSAAVIDYKFSGKSKERLKEKYSPQLALYKNAVCRIYGLGAEEVTTTIVNIKRLEQIDL